MSIQPDDNEDLGMSDSDAVAQLLSNMKAKTAKPAAEEPDEDEDLDEDDGLEEGDELPDDLDEDEEDDGLEEDEGEDDPEPEEEEGEKVEESPTATSEASDDAIVKVTVDGEESTFKVSDLKRLAGQEASLTRKSQEADLIGGRAAAALAGAIESVLEDLEPYKGLDWVLQGQRMEPDEFAWHRETYTRLQGRYDKLMGAARDFETNAKTVREAAMRERGEKAVAALKDATSGISGYNEQLHNDIIKYGVSQGLDPDDAGRIVDASVIKLIHKAMLFDKGKAAVAEKVKETPTKVRKGGSRAPASEPSATPRRDRAAEKKIATGKLSDRDAVSALLGRWGAKAR